ncbi:MAG: hypothetical protein EXR27_14545 [Betaproteobacteria bacterium]|nr:hypothetical protein [Betaproteobacteria bacterium]
MQRSWDAPEPGDIVWCRFPARPRDVPGPNPRPALVLTVTEAEDGIAVQVAYGTSQKLDRLLAGEFAIRRLENGAAYSMAGISYDTKFDLKRTMLLPWTEPFFGVPPEARHGQNPKLGSLHVGMLKAVAAAARGAVARRL